MMSNSKFPPSILKPYQIPFQKCLTLGVYLLKLRIIVCLPCEFGRARIFRGMSIILPNRNILKKSHALLHSKGMHSMYSTCLLSSLFCSGIAFSCITVPMMWITVANQNLHPLGLSQVCLCLSLQQMLHSSPLFLQLHLLSPLCCSNRQTPS